MIIFVLLFLLFLLLSLLSVFISFFLRRNHFKIGLIQFFSSSGFYLPNVCVFSVEMFEIEFIFLSFLLVFSSFLSHFHSIIHFIFHNCIRIARLLSIWSSAFLQPSEFVYSLNKHTHAVICRWIRYKI